MPTENQENYPELNRVNWDVIVIGSGFGGSVSALRLAEKGYKVLVIEKGKRYSNADFPKTNWNLRKYLWMPKLFMYGIQCITFLKNVFILHGSGWVGEALFMPILYWFLRIMHLKIKTGPEGVGRKNWHPIMKRQNLCWVPCQLIMKGKRIKF